jgi:hypothetical protein
MVEVAHGQRDEGADRSCIERLEVHIASENHSSAQVWRVWQPFERNEEVLQDELSGGARLNLASDLLF